MRRQNVLVLRIISFQDIKQPVDCSRMEETLRLVDHDDARKFCDEDHIEHGENLPNASTALSQWYIKVFASYLWLNGPDINANLCLIYRRDSNLLDVWKDLMHQTLELPKVVWFGVT